MGMKARHPLTKSCTHPWRLKDKQGRHEMYVSSRGVVCRACGAFEHCRKGEDFRAVLRRLREGRP